MCGFYCGSQTCFLTNSGFLIFFHVMLHWWCLFMWRVVYACTVLRSLWLQELSC